MSDDHWKKRSLDLYLPVKMPPFPPAWEDIAGLALHYPAVHHAVTLERRGNVTREQALILAVFALADAFQKLFSAELDRLTVTPSKHIVGPIR